MICFADFQFAGEQPLVDKLTEPINYPELRKSIGEANSAILMSQGGNFRRRLRIAFDTQVFQHCANEQVEEERVYVENGPWAGLETIKAKTVSAKKPSGKDDASDESECIYALCELGRRGDAEILDLPRILRERHHPRHGHYHGLERLDFKVPFLEYPVICSRMRRASSSLLNSADETEGCLRDVAHYGPLIQHVTGKGQKNDVFAYMEADMAGTDVFISLDGKFIAPFRQIEIKLRRLGAQTFVMRPSEFCRTAGLSPIPFPPPNSRQPMGSPAQDR